MTAEKPKLGEWSTEEVVTEEVKEFCIEMKPEIEKAAGTDFAFFAPLTFRRLYLDGGTQTLVKVYFGVDKCIHVLLSVIIIPEMPKSVSGVEFPKTASEPLIPFPVPNKK